VLTAARELTEKRLILVFGCGGNRDRDKRAKMGKAAGHFSDYSIITSDNPRDEEPASIASEIEKGIKQVVGSGQYALILDRKKAIEQAINMAEKGDIVIIAGKGHENYQLFKGRRIHFDDCETARIFVNGKLSMINEQR
jgi:UDP-N-acetylmuramoyl-L-alanyl-D-glutamate--2,6-diaminopimelate ligase